jgi:hypothetical protein
MMIMTKRKSRFKVFTDFFTAVIVLATLSGCTPTNVETLGINVKSDNPGVVDRSVRQLVRIMINADDPGLLKPDEEYAKALKIIVENMKDVPQCKTAFIELLRERNNRGHVTQYAKDYLNLSVLDDETANALATYAEGSTLTSFIDTIPIPSEYERITRDFSKYDGVSKKYSLGTIAVVYSYNKEYYCFHTATFSMPKEHRISIDNLGNADTVIKLDYYKSSVGSYENGVDAVRISAVMRIYDLKTQHLVYSETFDGSDPPQFTNMPGGAQTGTKLNSKDIIELLTTCNFMF